MDAVERLRKKAQNEATCLALNTECRLLRQQLATLKSDYCNIDSAADAQAAELYKVKQQLAECQSKWEHFENSVAEKSMQCLSLEKELAECQRDAKRLHVEIHDQAAEIAGNHAMLKFKDEQLAECQRERDEYLRDLGAMKNWIADWHKKDTELATVIKERDELVVALGRIASSRVVDIAQAALAKLGADNGEK